MIVSICLNPSVDVALTIKKLKLGKINRTQNVIRVAGGKGNNVARITKILGEDTLVIEPVGGSDGQFICSELARLGIDYAIINITQPTRRCIAIIDEDFITEVRENGPTLTDEEYQQFINLYKQNIKKASVITASGSLPKGINNEAYADLIKIAQKHNVPFFLDAKAEALYNGIKAKPTLVKINETELAEWSGIKLNSIQQYINALSRIKKEGIEIAIVSLGEKGMLAYWKNKLYQVKVPLIKIKSTVGCGDATMAGIAVAYKQNLGIKQVLKLGAACGSAAAMQTATGIINLRDLEHLKAKIKITELT